MCSTVGRAASIEPQGRWFNSWPHVELHTLTYLLFHAFLGTVKNTAPYLCVLCVRKLICAQLFRKHRQQVNQRWSDLDFGSAALLPGFTQRQLSETALQKKRERKHLFIVRPRVFVKVRPLVYWGFFGVCCLTTKHKPFRQTNESECWRERGGRPRGPNCRDGHSLTAAFILLLFLFHTQGFLVFLKVFLSLSPSSPLPHAVPPPSTYSFFLSPGCDWLLWQSNRRAVSLF